MYFFDAWKSFFIVSPWLSEGIYSYISHAFFSMLGNLFILPIPGCVKAYIHDSQYRLFSSEAFIIPYFPLFTGHNWVVLGHGEGGGEEVGLDPGIEPAWDGTDRGSRIA